jgi:short-subunit dehydrogenase
MGTDLFVLDDPARPGGETVVKAEVVVVTGASSGIGLATSIAYARRHAHLVLVARDPTRLAVAGRACTDAGAASVDVVAADVLDEVALDEAFRNAVARYGRVDVVVHSAMVMAYGTIEELPLDVIDHVVETATHGTVRVARAALRVFRMQARGTLVIVTSLLASVPVPGIGSYITGKWAQSGLARVLRLETADAPDILIITVAPGAVDTPIYRNAANFVGRVGKPPPPVYRAETVATAILRAVDERRQRVSVGVTNLLIIAGFRWVTPLYERLVGPLYRRFALGRAETPPTTGNVWPPSARS